MNDYLLNCLLVVKRNSSDVVDVFDGDSLFFLTVHLSNCLNHKVNKNSCFYLNSNKLRFVLSVRRLCFSFGLLVCQLDLSKTCE